LWCPEPKHLLLFILVCALAGCGFQLRTSDISRIDAIHISGSVSSDMRRAFQESLSAHGVESTAAAPGVINVRILDQRSSRRPVSTSASIDAAQYELRLEMDIAILRDGQPLTTDMTVFAERIYSLDSVNLSGSYEEQQLLMDGIRADLVSQVIRRIVSVTPQ